MKRFITGFALLIAALVLAWFTRDRLVTVFVIPFILGIHKISLLIDTLPQLLWWIITVMVTFSLFFTTVQLPRLKLIKSRKKKYPGGKLDMLDSLIKETEKGSTWSGQQLALILINLFRKSEGMDEMNIHKLKNDLDRMDLPDELRPFVISQFTDDKAKSNTASRLTLEKALRYLKQKEMRK